ncbi:MAG TPA: hypothetical protein VKG79_01815 [Bryobacteraceae bacterium]|nr:hypothetical protein [Bryobacteraceae bacterium]
MSRSLVLFLLLPGVLLCAGKERVVESVLPSLEYGPACWSSVDLQNLGDREVKLDIEAHRASGALVALVDHPQLSVDLGAGERASFRLEIAEETGSAWAKVREHVPAAALSPVIAVSGHSECVVDNQLRTSAREVAFPLRSPAFSSDIDEIHGDLVSMVNTSEYAAQVSLCYSEGNLYSVPGRAFAQICSSAFDVQVPPFGARRFPVEREGSSHFSMKTRGNAIVLQMLKPVGTGVKTFAVDSSIKFGEEATVK